MIKGQIKALRNEIPYLWQEAKPDVWERKQDNATKILWPKNGYLYFQWPATNFSCNLFCFATSACTISFGRRFHQSFTIYISLLLCYSSCYPHLMLAISSDKGILHYYLFFLLYSNRDLLKPNQPCQLYRFSEEPYSTLLFIIKKHSFDHCYSHVYSLSCQHFVTPLFTPFSRLLTNMLKRKDLQAIMRCLTGMLPSLQELLIPTLFHVHMTATFSMFDSLP